jgi:hypothetical protein
VRANYTRLKAEPLTTITVPNAGPTFRYGRRRSARVCIQSSESTSGSSMEVPGLARLTCAHRRD